jgi:hypothetical protein
MFLYVKAVPLHNTGTCKIAFKTYRHCIDHTATHKRPHERHHQKAEIGSVAPSILRCWHLREFYLTGPEKHRTRAQMTRYCDRLSASGWRGGREILAYQEPHYLRYALFWDNTQIRVVVSYRRLGTNYLFYLQKVNGLLYPSRRNRCFVSKRL